jgi:glycosyltransferase involved in cell wall biosynthesis
MSVARSLSVVVPAHNEAENICATLDNVIAALAPLDIDYEIIAIDDGSSDGTRDVVRAYAVRYPQIHLLVNDRNMGFGWTYRRGIENATRSHIVMVHGDNAWGYATLRNLFARTGEADIVIGYTTDMWRSRSFARTLVSRTFTMMVNGITRRRLTYYNGLQIHDAAVLKTLRIQSSGYGFQAEVLVKALRRCDSFIEVPMQLTERAAGRSKAFRMKNAVDVARTLALLCRLEWGGATE